MLVPLLQNIFGAGGEIIVPPPGTRPFFWSFADYPAFRAALQTLIDGDDYSTSTLSVATLDLIVGLAEKRLYRDVRSATQDAPLSATVSNNHITLPADCIEIRSLYFTSGVSLQYMAYEQLQQQIQRQGQTARNPVNFAQEADTVLFWPRQADGTTILGRYYKYYASIVTQGLTGNLFFQRWPELWMYAALSEASPYLGEVSRAPEWEKRYQQVATDILEYERRRITRGSKLVTRVA